MLSRTAHSHSCYRTAIAYLSHLKDLFRVTHSCVAIASSNSSFLAASLPRQRARGRDLLRRGIVMRVTVKCWGYYRYRIKGPNQL